MKICGIIIFSIFTILYVTSALPNTQVVQKICNGIKFDQSSPISSSIYYVQNDVAIHTSDHGYNYYTSSPWDMNIAYGHGVCNGGLSGQDCDACMLEAFTRITRGCPRNTGAQVQLGDCRIRYEIYAFLE